MGPRPSAKHGHPRSAGGAGGEDTGGRERGRLRLMVKELADDPIMVKSVFRSHRMLALLQILVTVDGDAITPSKVGVAAGG